MGRYKVTKRIEFCYGHRLLNYQGKCKNLHGHNALLEIDVESDELDSLGMVVDFHVVRDVVKSWVDEHIDHKLILGKHDPLAAAIRELDQPVFLLDDNPTAENISKRIFLEARERGLPVTEVRLWETTTGCARYRDD